MTSSSKLKTLIVAAFCLAAAVFVFMRGTNASSAAVILDASSSPRTLYVQNCARCHGSDGKANTALGRKYKADDISGGVGVNKTIRIVTNGKGHMPSFKKRLSSTQISQIANYVHGM